MMCTVGRARWLTVAVFVLCYVLTASTPHEWVVVTDAAINTTTNTTVYTMKLDYSALGQDELYRHSYYWFNAVVFILVPLALLAVFNFFLISAVHRNYTVRMAMTQERHRCHEQENRITVMLISVVVLALCCQLPSAVLLLYSAVQQPPAPHTPAYAIMRGLGNIFNLLNAINAAVNIVLYCAFSDKYRRTFLKMFLPCVFRRKTRSLSFLTTAGDPDALAAGTGQDYGRTFRLSSRSSATKSLRAAPHSNRSSLHSSRSSSFRSTRPTEATSRFTDRKARSGEGFFPGDGAWSARRNNSTCSPAERSASSTASYDSKQIKRFSFDPSPSDTPVPEYLVIPDITITTTSVTTTTITTPSTVNTSMSSPPLEAPSSDNNQTTPSVFYMYSPEKMNNSKL